MADTTALDKAKADAAGLWGNLKKGFSEAASDLVRWENDPAGLMFDKLKKDPAFASDANQKKLSVITNDKRFMSALNTGMVNDPSVKASFVEAYTSNTDGTSTMKYVDSLQSGMNRRTGASVLNAAGKSATDDLDGKYVMDVLAAGQAAAAKDAKSEDRKRMQELLAKSGTRDIRLEFAENPMGMLKEMFANPSEFFKMLPELLGFQGVQAERMGELLQSTLGGTIEFFTANKHDRATAANIYDKVSAKVEYYYDGISGERDKRNALQDRGQEILVKNSSAATPNETMRETNKGGAWDKVVGKTQTAELEGDRTNVAMAEDKRAKSQFDLARHGITPNVTPEQERDVAAYDAQQSLRRQGAAPSVPALG